MSYCHDDEDDDDDDYGGDCYYSSDYDGHYYDDYNDDSDYSFWHALFSFCHSFLLCGKSKSTIIEVNCLMLVSTESTFINGTFNWTVTLNLDPTK